MKANNTIVYYIPWYWCEPPHGVTHPEKLDELIEKFTQVGFSTNYSPLIGYEDEGQIQLITGSHRWAACKSSNRTVPVLLQKKEYLNDIWGSELWVELCNFNVPIENLNWIISDV